MPEQPTDGLYLGVDVGYSEINESLGYCVLENNAGVLHVRREDFGVSTYATFEKSTLPDLLKRNSFAVIAFDGPLTRKPETSPHYRPQEHLTLLGEFPARIKAAAFQSPVGLKLYEASMRLKKQCEDNGYRYAPYSEIAAYKDKMILEAFPKLWLALFLKPETLSPRLAAVRNRSLRDWKMAQWLFTVEQSNAPSIGEFSVNLSKHKDMFEDPTQKDVVSALVSAVGGVLAHAGHASVIGNDTYGSFLLPSSCFWAGDWKNRVERARNRMKEKNLAVGFIDNV